MWLWIPCSEGSLFSLTNYVPVPSNSTWLDSCRLWSLETDWFHNLYSYVLILLIFLLLPTCLLILSVYQTQPLSRSYFHQDRVKGDRNWGEIPTPKGSKSIAYSGLVIVISGRYIVVDPNKTVRGDVYCVSRLDCYLLIHCTERTDHPCAVQYHLSGTELIHQWNCVS